MVNSIIEILVTMKLMNIEFDGETILFEFNIGQIPMHDFKSNDVQAFVDFVKEKYKLNRTYL